MSASNFGFISALLVTEFDYLEGNGRKFVLYTLLVEGRYRLLHPSSYFSGKPLKFNNSPAFKIRMRYRDMLQMHSDLSRVHDTVQLPEFPPKKWFGHRSEKFICRRMNLLNEYFRKLMLIDEIRSSECLLKAIQPSKSLDLVILGQERVGKARFVKKFLHHKPAGVEVSSEFSALVNHITSRSLSSALATDSTVYSEIEQFTPIDVIVDDWLVRINSIHVRNNNCDLLSDDVQKTDVLIQQKDGVMVAYEAGNEASQQAAQRMLKHLRRRANCTLVGLGPQASDNYTEAGDSGDFAYRVFTDFVRKLVAS